MEAKPIENFFGESALRLELPVSSTKSMTGHLLGGRGGLAAGITILSILNQVATREPRGGNFGMPIEVPPQ
jgi:3-oxoacyl-[acyl-carrier-protein] synthase II